MVRLSKIYTRAGDDGSTALGSGERRPKDDLRIEAYGTVDETNAALGLARLHTAGADLDPILARIQNELFDLGADLATPTPPGVAKKPDALRIHPDQVSHLERDLDALNEALEPLNSFVLPGGSPAAAALHLARTMCRRAERLMVALGQTEPVDKTGLAYVNRLSDFLFVAARHANAKAGGDVLWKPGATHDAAK